MLIKVANAAVLHTDWSREQWERVRREGRSSKIRTAELDQHLLGRFDPSRYLLSHVTIVASVDTEDSPLPLGRFDRGGKPLAAINGSGSVRSLLAKPVLDRRYSDFLVKADTAKYVNDNGDAWERKQLLKTFRTFVGSPNFLEHIQIPELSKGVLVDAVARDIGPSIYVDLLVATELKHRDLVSSIRRGELDTLSMGAHVEFTICTHPGCGNVAFDDEQLCDHAKRLKGKVITDEDGTRRVICELCGHASADGSNIFIEASWVKNPAFCGAVSRALLSPVEIGKAAPGMDVASAIERAEKIRAATPVPSDTTAMARAASRRRTAADEDFDLGGDEPAEEPKKAPEKADPLKKVKDKIKDRVRQEAGDELEDELRPPKGKVPEALDLNDSLNASRRRANATRLARAALVASLHPHR